MLQPALVTPGGHRRFDAQDLEGVLPGEVQRMELVGSAEAARLLGVSQPTLGRAVRKGRLQPAAVTPGGHRRFAVRALLESRRAFRDAGRAEILVAAPGRRWIPVTSPSDELEVTG